MTDLATQLRTYYEATTTPADVENIAVEPGTVLVGPAPDTARRRSAMSTRTVGESRTWLKGSRAAVAALLATVGVIAAIIFVTSDSDSDVAADRSPAAVLFAFQDAYNATDLDRVVKQFAPEATILRYPNAFYTNAAGREEIKALFASELNNDARYEMTEVEVTGNVVTFRHRWGGPGPELDFCRTAPGHRMVVEDGLIQSWEWPTTTARC